MRPVIDHHEACLPTAAASDESSLHTSTAQKPLHRQSMLGTPPQAVADQMHDAGLQRRGRKNRSQSLRYSFEAIRDGDQNILNATSLEVVVPGIVDVSELAHCIGILKLLYIEVCRLDSSEAATVGT
ncbi:hypothetical protein ALO81_200116 [Pseudomonas cannabina]|uniref:Conjugal transfer protein n=1 Tax=Pseudomonas cannabina TaxID=86840 RepID=A0A0P9M0L3_PSECA|nr:hypothetical protein ALO81_200116 [Pseudomonas cannabina]